MGKFAVMGFLDASAGFLSSFGGAFVDGSLQNLLNQTAIPATMILSLLYLRVSYTSNQYGGSTAIVIGAATAILPSLGSSSHQHTTTLGVLLYLANIAPQSASNVYKEAAFRTKMHTDIYLLSCCVATFQILFGFAFLPLLALPGFGGISFSEMPAQLSNGWICFTGRNPMKGDHCASEFWYNTATSSMVNYCTVNFAYNVLTLMVTKHGSAALMVISAALALPITNLAFSTPLLMGSAAEHLTPFDLIALAIVVVGFVLYSAGDAEFLPPGPHEKKKGEKARLLPVQAAGGSMLYTRKRSSSDPTTPKTPRRSPGSGSGVDVSYVHPAQIEVTASLLSQHQPSSYQAIDIPGTVNANPVGQSEDLAQSL